MLGAALATYSNLLDNDSTTIIDKKTLFGVHAQVSFVLEPGDGFKNPETIEMLSLGLSNDEVGILLYQSGAD